MTARHGDARHRNRAHELRPVQLVGIGQWRALQPHQLVDRYRFRLWLQIRQAGNQPGPLLAGLVHADDAAAAHLQPGLSHLAQGIEPVIEPAGMNQLAVIAWIGVQVVVVVVEAGFLQVLGHAFFQQAKGATGLQSQRLHRPDDRLQLFDVARLRATPCSAHAEAAGTPCLGNACLLQHALHVHQLLGWHRIGMMDGLRAVCAVLGAAPGLHRQQGRELDALRIEVLPVHGGRTIDQVHERRLEQGFHRADCPVGSGGVWCGAAQLDCGHRIGHACVSWLWPVASGGYSVSGASGQFRSLLVSPAVPVVPIIPVIPIVPVVPAPPGARKPAGQGRRVSHTRMSRMVSCCDVDMQATWRREAPSAASSRNRCVNTIADVPHDRKTLHELPDNSGRFQL